MHADLVLGTKRRQDREGDARSRAAVEAGPGPDVTPRRPSDEFLEWGGEVGGRRRHRVDVSVAQDLATDPYALVVALSVHVVASARSATRCWVISAFIAGGSLDVGKVRRAVDDGDLALRYGRGDSACLIDRSSRIVRAGDDQCRRRDAREVAFEIQTCDGLATCGVSLVGRRGEHLANERLDPMIPTRV